MSESQTGQMRESAHPGEAGVAYTSRLSGFHRLPLDDRQRLLADVADLSEADLLALAADSDATTSADADLENVIGSLSLPLAIATNLIVNGHDVLVPMAIEEPSVLAALSYGALITRRTGGVSATSMDSEIIGQIQVYGLEDPQSACARVLESAETLLAAANTRLARMVERGGGARALNGRVLRTRAGDMLVVHLIVDVRDAMGANLVNSACEALAPAIVALTGGEIGVRVLSNLADRRVARATCRVTAESLARDGVSGERVVGGILAAQALAEADPYRAATHNKGILNGIDAVALATGNDWRAIEAGAHAYATREGTYRPLTSWERDEAGDLMGAIELPMAVGTHGAAVRAHRASAVALKIMGVDSARSLAEIMAAVGLVQNLAALRALVTEGIQQGHMRLHARQVALAAGAPAAEVDVLAARMVAEGAISTERARELLRGRQEN